MGGDAILHHPGNSTRVDFISRTFRAGRHSKSYIDELHFNCKIMYRSSALDMEEVLCDETILALNRHGQGWRLDPVSALRQAEEIFNHSGALLPPNNATFRLVWFLERDRWCYNEVTSGSNIQLRICFEIMSSRTVHYYWRIWNCLRVSLLKLSRLLWNYGTV